MSDNNKVTQTDPVVPKFPVPAPVGGYMCECGVPAVTTEHTCQYCEEKLGIVYDNSIIGPSMEVE